jgi:magnesium transporter
MNKGTKPGKVRKRRKSKLGMSPGSLVFTGEQKLSDAHVTITQYNEGQYETEESFEIPTISADKITWIDVRGIHDPALIERLGRAFDIHPLVLEDIMDVHQRPKFEDYQSGFYLTLRNFKFISETRTIVPEQVSIYAGANYVFSFQEDAEELFGEVITRLESGRGKLRQRGADYLVYALMDRIVDGYFVLLDQIGESIEDLETEILNNLSRHTKQQIHDLKRQLLSLRRSISPLRDAIGLLIKSDSKYISDQTIIFLRDLYDHCIQVFDILETSRDNLTSLQDLYNSELSFKTNSVMQVLTVVATIFIPLTFLVGVYGMNFDYLPELHWKHSYFILWLIMIFVALIMLVYFRKKKWL